VFCSSFSSYINQIITAEFIHCIVAAFIFYSNVGCTLSSCGMDLYINIPCKSILMIYLDESVIQNFDFYSKEP